MDVKREPRKRLQEHLEKTLLSRGNESGRYEAVGITTGPNDRLWAEDNAVGESKGSNFTAITGVRIKTEPVDVDSSVDVEVGEVEGQNEPIKSEPMELLSTHNAFPIKCERVGEDVIRFKEPIKSETQDLLSSYNAPSVTFGREGGPPCKIKTETLPQEDASLTVQPDGSTNMNSLGTVVKQEDGSSPLDLEPEGSTNKSVLGTVIKLEPGLVDRSIEEESLSSQRTDVIGAGCIMGEVETEMPKVCSLDSSIQSNCSPIISTGRRAKMEAQLSLQTMRDDDDDSDESSNVNIESRSSCDYNGPNRRGRKLGVWGYQPNFGELLAYGVKLKPCFVKVISIPNEVLAKHGLEPEKKIDLETLKKGLFSCSDCSYRTFYKQQLRQHVKEHDYTTDFHTCPICGFKANWDTGLMSHLKAVHAKETLHVCPHCDYKCAYAQSLKVHLRRHNGELPYSCKYCDYKASTMSTLQTHLRTHSGDRPFVCPHCPYRARQYPHLKTHLFVHLDLKPFSCEQCKFTTRQKSHLNVHVRLVHTSERPLQCCLCDHAAKTKQALETHIRCQHTKEEPFVCKECSFKSSHQSILRAHKIGHRQKHAHTCPYCTWSTKRSGTLDCHVAKCHPAKLPDLIKCELCDFRTLDQKRLRNHVLTFGKNHMKRIKRKRQQKCLNAETDERYTPVFKYREIPPNMPDDHPVVIILQDGNGFVWDSDDWLKLRRDHRIVGNLVGCLANIPRQESINGMPAVLLPEELTLVLEKSIGVLMKLAEPLITLPESIKDGYKEHSDKVQKEQVEVYERKRKIEVRGMIDRIIEGKRRKIARGESTIPIDEESIFEAEMARVKKIEVGVFVQIPTANPWMKEEDLFPAEWTYPKTPLETLRCRVFRDLWEQGFYLTAGSKFGGHFLVYPGEPLKFHAFYVVIVALPDDGFSPLDLVRHARLATNTKKTFVIATTDSENQLTYSSFEWTGKT